MSLQEEIEAGIGGCASLIHPTKCTGNQVIKPNEVTDEFSR
jgi:hypothetical protein